MINLTVLTVLAVVQGGKWKSCERRIQKFERCLEKGYKSKAGCVSGEGKLEGFRAWRRCKRLEKKISKKCDYVCEKEPALIPEECRLRFARLIGTEVKSLQPSTFEDCRVECSNDPDCEAFNFLADDVRVTTDDLKCQLLIDVTGMDRTTQSTGMMKGCDRSEVDMSCLEENIAYYNEDFSLDTWMSYVVASPYVRSIEECAKVCRDFKDCKSLSFVHYEVDDETECSLLNDVPGEDESDLKKVNWKTHSSMTMNCDAI